MGRHFKLCSLFLSIFILLNGLGLTGCRFDSESSQDIVPAQTQTRSNTPTPTPIAPELCTPTPTPDYDQEAHAEAVATAAEHGLTEDDLKGQYARFLRFASTIDSNNNLGQYSKAVYSLFPMIANQLTSEREEHFLARVYSLSIRERNWNSRVIGEYYQNTNDIHLNLVYANSDYYSLDSALFHELVHFTDTNIDGDIESVRFCENGIFPQNDTEGAILSGNDRVHQALFIKEGCAELYSAKYYTKFADTYTTAVQFFVGLEHIIGEEALDELFFSHDSGYRMAQLLLDNGFTEEEVWIFFETMNAVSRYSMFPQAYIRPEDALIRLYTNIIGPNYMEDLIFCHILRGVYNDVYYPLDQYPSLFQMELESIIMTEDETVEWFYSIMNQIKSLPVFEAFEFLIRGMYLDGEFLLTSVVTVYPSVTEKIPLQTLIIDYDFETEQVRSAELYAPPSLKDE